MRGWEGPGSGAGRAGSSGGAPTREAVGHKAELAGGLEQLRAPPFPRPEAEKLQAESTAAICWLKSPLLQMGNFRARE